jgi:hypothetical protein
MLGRKPKEKFYHREHRVNRETERKDILKNLPKKLFFSLCVLRYLCGYLAGGLFDQTSSRLLKNPV